MASDYITLEEVLQSQAELSSTWRKELTVFLRKCGLIFLEGAAFFGVGLYFLRPAWSISQLAMIAAGSSALLVGLGAAVVIVGLGRPTLYMRSELRKLEKRIRAGESILRPNPLMQPTGQQQPAAD